MKSNADSPGGGFIKPANGITSGLHRWFTQSLAIIEYLEEKYPEPPILPLDIQGRARVRSLALSIACEIHPLNNLKVLKYLSGTLEIDEKQKNDWYHHWIAEGFRAFEARLSNDPATGRFCHGDYPTLADACLVPQVYNARRFECDLNPYPKIVEVEQACLDLVAFGDAAPDNQPDAKII